MKVCKNGKLWGRINTDYHDSEYVRKQREAKLGSKNPNWKGGINEVTKRKTKTGLNGKGWRKGMKGENNPNYGKHLSKETKEKISKANKGRARPDMRKIMLENNPMKNIKIAKKMSLTRRNRIKEGKIKIWDKGIKRPDSSIILKKLRKEPKFIKRLIKSLMKRPTKPEQKLIKIIQKHNFPFIYCGDGGFVIEGYNPDFIDNNGSKRIIEVFGDYWHNLPRQQEQDKRKFEVYSKYGFKTFVLWEHELKVEDDVINKIRRWLDE